MGEKAKLFLRLLLCPFRVFWKLPICPCNTFAIKTIYLAIFIMRQKHSCTQPMLRLVSYGFWCMELMFKNGEWIWGCAFLLQCWSLCALIRYSVLVRLSAQTTDRVEFDSGVNKSSTFWVIALDYVLVVYDSYRWHTMETLLAVLHTLQR